MRTVDQDSLHPRPETIRNEIKKKVKESGREGVRWGNRREGEGIQNRQI